MSSQFHTAKSELRSPDEGVCAVKKSPQEKSLKKNRHALYAFSLSYLAPKPPRYGGLRGHASRTRSCCRKCICRPPECCACARSSPATRSKLELCGQTHFTTFASHSRNAVVFLKVAHHHFRPLPSVLTCEECFHPFQCPSPKGCCSSRDQGAASLRQKTGD